MRSVALLVLAGCFGTQRSDDRLRDGYRQACDEGRPEYCYRLASHQYAGHTDAERADADDALHRACRLGAKPEVRARPPVDLGHGFDYPAAYADRACMELVLHHRPMVMTLDPPEQAAIDRRICLDPKAMPREFPEDYQLCACERLELRARAGNDATTAGAATAAFPGRRRPGCQP